MENQQGPRKATDVLLDLENKVDTLLNIIKSQDLNIKVLSNKLNMLMEKMEKQTSAGAFVNSTPQFTAEAINAAAPPHFATPQTPAADKQIPIFSEYQLPLEEAPVGFRRTSRPETYAGDDSYLQKPATASVKFPTQVPKPPPGRSPQNPAVPPEDWAPSKPPEIVVPPPPVVRSQGSETPAAMLAPSPQPRGNIGTIPVEQRVVDKNNKTIFLADVDITDHQTAQQVYKTRTNGAGKWMASLPIGNYRVTITKRESVTKQKVEVVQDIQVDGRESPLTLPMMIIK